MEQSIWYDTTISCNKTANSMAKNRLQMVFRYLYIGECHRQPGIIGGVSDPATDVGFDNVIDNRELSVVYRVLTFVDFFR